MAKPLKYSELKYLELQAGLEEKLKERRTNNSVREVIYVKNGNKRKSPVKMYKSQTPYVFLQYIRMVQRWASYSSGLEPRYVDLLLYLYPIGVFDQFQFNHMCRTVEIFSKRVLKVLIKKGFIKLWREEKKKTEHNDRQHALYCLTHKGALLCSRMHDMCLLEEEIPVTKRNPMTSSKKAIDKYYLRVIKGMNERVREKKKPETESNR